MSKGLCETASALRAGAETAQVCCEQVLACIRAREAQIHAWAALDEPRALAIAASCDALAIDARRSGAPLGPLHGIPVGIKDIIDTADLPTQMGSPVFEGHQPLHNAAVADRLIAAGAYVLGKTVTTEFAFMHPGATVNPWHPGHTPGGSSSGSAAAVAAGMVPGAIGTQTNGSVIRPAAFCGVVGFKPSFGLIPVSGALAFSPALDQLGVFTRSVADAAMLAAAVADRGAISPDVAPVAAPPRIACLRHYPWNRADADAEAQFLALLERLRSAGAEVAEVSLSGLLADAQQVHRTIMVYEGARQHLPRQQRHRAKMSAVLNAVIDQGMAITQADYEAALAQAQRVREAARELFRNCDVVASLPAPGVAPAGLAATGDPSFCTLWSLTGSPALTLPTGLSAKGLPYGIQLAAAYGADDALLRTARWCEVQVGFSRTPY